MDAPARSGAAQNALARVRLRCVRSRARPVRRRSGSSPSVSQRFTNENGQCRSSERTHSAALRRAPRGAGSSRMSSIASVSTASMSRSAGCNHRPSPANHCAGSTGSKSGGRNTGGRPVRRGTLAVAAFAASAPRIARRECQTMSAFPGMARMHRPCRRRDRDSRVAATPAAGSLRYAGQKGTVRGAPEAAGPLLLLHGDPALRCLASGAGPGIGLAARRGR